MARPIYKHHGKPAWLARGAPSRSVVQPFADYRAIRNAFGRTINGWTRLGLPSESPISKPRPIFRERSAPIHPFRLHLDIGSTILRPLDEMEAEGLQ